MIKNFISRFFNCEESNIKRAEHEALLKEMEEPLYKEMEFLYKRWKLNKEDLSEDFYKKKLISLIVGSIDYNDVIMPSSCFIGADLYRIAFCESKLANSIFFNSSIKFVDFGEADLTNAVFSNAKMLDVRFNGANLTNANFYNVSFCRYSYIWFQEAILVGSSIAKINIQDVDNIFKMSFKKAQMTDNKENRDFIVRLRAHGKANDTGSIIWVKEGDKI